MERNFYIKNMVCDRCIRVLKDALETAALPPKQLELGSLVIELKNPERDLVRLQDIASKNGFTLLQDPEEVLVEQIKLALIELTSNLPLHLKTRLSDFLADRLNQPYARLSKTFSTREQLTVEKYFIRLKIEKVKELIQSEKHNFTEISELLDYTNIHHLSRQFKSETGMKLTDFRLLRFPARQPLDKII